MARAASRYVCQSCGAVSSAWEGRCHVCGTWDSVVETVAAAASRTGRGRLASASSIGQQVPRPLRDVATIPAPRLSVGIDEVDRVLGGGLVPGALVLLGGEPGIGKSTLVLEIAAGVARHVAPGARTHPDGGSDVLYASGEESADQL
ncbi:MAG: DNA repair protein RadA, partial [Chloroflexi bacterium]|nr:DNA repair protein RadA [Chloroflexota bacterium]